MAAWANILDRLAALLAHEHAEGWLVGGCLRDALLGHPVRDLDVAVTADPATLARHLAPAVQGIASLQHNTFRVVVNTAAGTHLDISPLQGDTIGADLALRDFTIDALALPLARRERLLAVLTAPVNRAPREALRAALLDPLGGVADLRARKLRVASDAALMRDPGRIVRGARLVAKLGLAETRETLLLARAAAPTLDALSPDRKREEMAALLAEPSLERGLNFLYAMESLAHLLPGAGELSVRAYEHMVATMIALRPLRGGGPSSVRFLDDAESPLVSPHLRAWYAEAAPGESVPRIIALGWAALLHAWSPHGDAAEGEKVSVGWRGLPRRAFFAARTWHEAYALLQGPPRDLARARQFFDRAAAERGEPAVDALLLALACARAPVLHGHEDAAATYPALAHNAARLIALYFDERETLMPPPLLAGGDLMRVLGMAPGPAIGALLRRVRAAQLAGEIATRDEALALARQASAEGSADAHSDAED